MTSYEWAIHFGKCVKCSHLKKCPFDLHPTKLQSRRCYVLAGSKPGNNPTPTDEVFYIGSSAFSIGENMSYATLLNFNN